MKNTIRIIDSEYYGSDCEQEDSVARDSDGDLDQDGGLAGRIKGSFDRNYAVVLDNQIIKRF